MFQPKNQPPEDPFSHYSSHNPFAEADSFAGPGKRSTAEPVEAWGVAMAPETMDDEDVTSDRPRAVEVLITWGNSVLHIAHLSPPRSFVVGEVSDGSGEGVDVHLPEGLIGRKRLPLVVVERGVPYVVLPDIARGTLHTESGVVDLRAALDASPACPIAPRAKQRELDGKTRLAMRLGEIDICIRLVTKAAPFEKGIFANWDRAVPSYFALTAATFGGFMAALAYFVPPLGFEDESLIDKKRLLAISHYLDASSEREKEQQREPVQQAGAEESGASAQASPGPAGTAGKDNSPHKNKRVAVKGPRDTPELQLSKREALILARDFGVIGILNAASAADPDAPVSIFGRDVTLGNNELSANGNLWAADIGEAIGSGGLSVFGPGPGGNFGDGTGIGIANIGGGLLGPGNGKEGWGRSNALTQGGHIPKGPRINSTGETVLSGRIPAHVVQRIVRQNFGRFRMCYQQGLARNPTLEGRIPVRFVINRDGAVSSVSTPGGFPDAGVQSCVQSAFYGLSFPQPDGGVVTVTYPLMFSPS